MCEGKRDELGANQRHTTIIHLSDLLWGLAFRFQSHVILAPLPSPEEGSSYVHGVALSAFLSTACEEFEILLLVLLHLAPQRDQKRRAASRPPGSLARDLEAAALGNGFGCASSGSKAPAERDVEGSMQHLLQLWKPHLLLINHTCSWCTEGRALCTCSE